MTKWVAVVYKSIHETQRSRNNRSSSLCPRSQERPREEYSANARRTSLEGALSAFELLRGRAVQKPRLPPGVTMTAHLEGRIVGRGLCEESGHTERLLHHATCQRCLVVLDVMMTQGFKPKRVYGAKATTSSWHWRRGPKRPFAALFVRGAAVRGWLEARGMKQPSDVLGTEGA